MRNPMQNTHWYKGVHGWTSQPEYALPGEIARVGWHDCTQEGCETPCSGSIQDFYLRSLQATQVAEETASDFGAAFLWLDEKW